MCVCVIPPEEVELSRAGAVVVGNEHLTVQRYRWGKGTAQYTITQCLDITTRPAQARFIELLVAE